MSKSNTGEGVFDGQPSTGLIGEKHGQGQIQQEVGRVVPRKKKKADRKDGRDKDKTQTRLASVNGN